MGLFKYIGKRLKVSFEREPHRTLEQWCEEEVIFTDLEVSPILGNFKIKYSPHYRKMFALIERNATKTFFAKYASQSGKSLFAVLVAAHRLDTKPATVMYAQPTSDNVSIILQTKINPVLKSIPKLWQKFEDYKDKEKVRTKDAAKKLAGGNFLVVGSGVKARKSQTSPFIVLDEIGEFEQGAVAEFSERVKSFSKFFPKIIGVSTIVHPNDEICTNFNSCSVKIEWHYICPSCKTDFYPDVKYFKYPTLSTYLKEHNLAEDKYILNKYIDYAKDLVHMECPECSFKINTAEKDKMIANGGMDWYIRHEDGSSEPLIVENLTTETSFGADMNSFGSFFITYEDMVETIIKVGDDETRLDKLYRGWFNRFYEKKHLEKAQDDMLLLGNGVAEWVVPPDTIRIYLTIDNQKDYLFAQVTAIGYGVNPHIMYFGRIETWNQAEELWDACQYLKDEDGNDYMVSKMGIDRRGYNEGQVSRTDEADEFVNYMTQKWGEDRVYAMEGHPDLTGGKATMVVNHKDYSNQRRELKIKVIKFSNLYIKNQLFRSIDRAILKAKAETEDDEGYNYTAKLFSINQDHIERDMQGVQNDSLTRMLTAEIFDYAKNPKTGKIAEQKSWIAIRKRNDATDTSCMALTLADQDKLVLVRKPSNESLTEAIESLSSLDFS